MSIAISRKAFLAAEWRDAVAVNTDVLTAHPLAVSTVEESLLLATADATAEANRRLSLRSAQYMRFELVVRLDAETDQIDLGDVIEVQSPRFGLSVVGSDAGALFRVLDIAPNARDGTIRITAWGSALLRNRATTTGALRVTTTGAYRVTG